MSAIVKSPSRVDHTVRLLVFAKGVELTGSESEPPGQGKDDKNQED